MLSELVGLGVLPDRREGGYGPEDVERVRLVQLLRRRGIAPAAVGAALVSRRDVFQRYFAQLYPDGDFPSITLEDAAARAGVDLDFARRIRRAGGLGGPGDLLAASDVEALRSMALAISAGFPEQALLQLVRVYGDALGRVGDAEARLFHFHVHQRLRREGLEGDALEAATTQSVEQLLALVDPAVLYFHRQGLARAVRDDLALHLAEDAGLGPRDDGTGRLLAAVGFIDLARFTALTDAMGDAAAIEILDRFSDLVRVSVAEHEGRLVKQIGDAFMLVFDDPRAAVSCALDIRDAAVAEPEFLGTRQGLHWGALLHREGDYYGAAVNLAARIVGEARSDGVLVSRDLRDRLDGSADVSFAAAGRRTLKHVAEPVELFEALRPGERASAARTIDPVCGMAVDAEAPVARLQLDGRDVMFCSPACLQQFVSHPDRYS